jgi:RNA polymerase sigma-70 factor (ECF subfamily)
VRTLADPEEAADALQDAMISAFRRAGSFRGDSAVTTWLHRIVVNACLDRLRRKAARPATGGTDERTLPPDQQAALVLVDMLGYPVADAAEVLGISQGTVKSRCARGRARLLPRLAHLRRAGGMTAGPRAGNRSGTGNVSPAQGGGDDQS